MFFKIFLLPLLISLITADHASEIDNNIPRIMLRSKGIMIKRVKGDGYPIEEHKVSTADGYVLSIHRIPASVDGKKKHSKSPIFLQHGLLCASTDWILSGPGKALAYILSDAGYDVWMGNARGNTYSRNHAVLPPSSMHFWDFSWNEIAMYDIPAMIDYILENTNSSSLHYIGHSQGTTVFFVLMSSLPEYNVKIKSAHMLAPVAFMGHIESPVVRSLAPIIGNPDLLVELMGRVEFLPNTELMSQFGQMICRDQSPMQEICSNILFLIYGYDSENLNRTMIPDIVQTTPAGASVKQIVHYVQEYNSKKFRKFDYGLLNMMKYGQETPPEYNLAAIIAPVFLYYGDNDLMAAVKDVHILASRLPNVVKNYRIDHTNWNHLNFLWGINAKRLLYDRILKNINEFDTKPKIIQSRPLNRIL